MALAHGFALPFEALRRTGVLAQNTADATIRATADGATKEAAGNCLDARALEVQQRTVVQPSILVVPQLTRNGVVLNQLPDTRTNFIQNNTMVGATGSVAPTTWSVVAPPSGISIGYSASGQTTAADGTLVDYIDVTVSGTALASGNFNLRPEPVTSTVSGNLLFASGMTYTASFYMSLLSGSVSGVSPNYQIQEVSGTTFVAGTSLDLSAITSNLTRYSLTRTLVGTGGADRIRTRYGHAIASGQVLNYTIRIASPQLEKGSVATPVIRTASGFVSVDMLGVARDGAPPDFTFTRATTATRVNASGLIESVASGVPRIDWLGQSCPALLVEAAGTNFARWVNQMTAQDTPAASGGMTITTGSTDFLAPDGTSGSITKYVGGAASGSSQYAYYSGGGVTVTASGQHTFSLFVKAGATNPLNFCALQFALYTGGSGTAISYFSLASGTALTAGASIQDYGNGWYRLISAPYTIASGDLSGNLIFSMAEGNGDVSFPASGALNLTAYIWGAQLETGSIATTYIPTTTASATRAADVCSVSGVSGYIGQTEGTIYAEVDVRNLGLIASLINIQTTAYTSGAVRIETTASNQLRIQIRDASGNSRLDNTISSPTLSSGINKIAVGYSSDASGVITALNGTIINTTTVSASFGSLGATKVHLGTREQAGAYDLFLNNRLRAAAIYTTRLTNDQLANITRLT
jgi:hypothetical protein